ncbi:RNA-binding ATPase activator esf2 [Curvularia kusanoi]|uniref:18S rRNA factor 2 n=1 Tax=Curvularia kusanoi TaxID=90978 RepID=A0A9P4TIM9_CURKU|nr:RNA-binding ATPase activator esf2 [Curvularia kusanoi]
MSTRKRNEWLDADESEDEDRGYESEEESRARTLPSSKRQKTTHSSEDEDDASDAESDSAQKQPSTTKTTDDISTKTAELARLEQIAAGLPQELKAQANKLAGAPIDLKAPSKDKSGVIYISRVPPFMKPVVLRSLLTPYGAVGRIFLTPEDSTARTQRLRGGGTRRKLFLDGWVEFTHKRDAKFVAENLNAQTMGGKKRGRWHDEVWNIKYLSGVKWAHLVEQIQNENAERAARLRFEIAQSKKENKRFLENVERGKMESGIAATREKRGEGEEKEKEGNEGPADKGAAEGKKKRKKLEFKQHAATSKSEKKPEPGQDVSRVLSKIF